MRQNADYETYVVPCFNLGHNIGLVECASTVFGHVRISSVGFKTTIAHNYKKLGVRKRIENRIKSIRWD
jgi:hypothetical protein